MANKKQKKIIKEKKVTYQDATLSRRFISYLIDWYVGALATALPISMIAKKLTGTMLNQNIMEFEAPYGLIGGVLGLICAFIYFVIVPLKDGQGQTLGKRICKIRIVKDNDENVELKTLLLRQVLGLIIVEGSLVSASAIWHQIATMLTGFNFVAPLMYIGIVVTGVSALLVAFKKDHRAIHDYIGKTKVVMCD